MNYFRCGGGRSTHTATKIAVAKTPLATFSGNVSGLNLAETIAYIVATQSRSGTPSPANPRTINGVDSVDTTCCGKNLFNGTNVINAYFSSNGTITASGATRLVYTRCKANTTYTVSKTAGTRFGVAYSEEVPVAGLQCSGYTANNTASSITITTGATAKYICAYVYHSSYDSGTAQDMLDSVQIEEGTATAYEAYNGTTATTALQTTCYGGYLNLETGVLTMDQVKEIKRWSQYVSTTTLTTYTRRTIALSNLVDNSRSIEMCSVAPLNESYSSDTHHFYCANSSGANPAGRLYLFLDENTLPQDFDEFEVTYPLATPTTEQLTPHQIEQLLGQNNVFASSGDVAVKYWKID